jgi:metal-sulfur cluster biosynthetic enzyme
MVVHSQNQVTINSGNGPTDINLTPTDAACGLDNGSIVISGTTGGTGPYTYNIDGGTYGNATSFTNLAAGSHTIGVQDANGCTFSEPVTINSGNGPTDINLTPTDAACGLDNGSIVISGTTGGTGPYTYNIDGGTYGNATSFTNLAAGSHTIGVQDANGCTFSEPVTINSGNGPTDINLTPTDAACGLDNGSISISGTTGGTGPYTYSIDGGGFTGTTSYTNLAVGTYAVTVRDANGCTFSEPVTINSGNGPTDINLTPTDAACGLDNGSFVINGVTGGVAPYTYSIDGGGFTGTTSYTTLLLVLML